jgi:acyl carrier protein
VLEDGTLAHQDAARLARALAPKAAGAWNLHRLTRDAQLDFFALFSSVVSLLGSPGQGPYAAANAFVDGLAHHRRAAGLPAVVINWGPWSGLGLSATESARRSLALADRAGVLGLAPDQARRALEQVLASGAAQVAVVRMDWERWARYEARSPHALTAELVAGARARAEGGGDPDLRRQFLAVPAGRRRRAAFERFVRDQVARVLELEPDTLDPRQPLGSFNFDSLMALELRTSLERGLGLSLPASVAWNYPTIAALVDFLAGEARLPLDAEAAPADREADADAVVRLLEGVRSTPVETLSRELELSARGGQDSDP